MFDQQQDHDADLDVHLFPQEVDDTAFQKPMWTDWYNPTTSDLVVHVHVQSPEPARGKRLRPDPGMLFTATSPPRVPTAAEVLNKKNWVPLTKENGEPVLGADGQQAIVNRWHGHYSRFTGKQTFVFRSKRTTRISSDWDTAIQKIDPDSNTIMAGQAPQLINRRHVDLPTLHHSLDDQHAKMVELQKRLSATVVQKAALYETHETDKMELESLREKLKADPSLRARILENEVALNPSTAAIPSPPARAPGAQGAVRTRATATAPGPKATASAATKATDPDPKTEN